MLHAFRVFKKEMLITLRDPVALIWLLALPIFIIAITSFAFSGSYGGGKFEVTIPVINRDSGPMGQQLLDAIGQQDTLKIELKTNDQEMGLRQQVADGKTVALLILPADLTTQVSTGKQAELQLLTDTNETTQLPMVTSILGSLISTFNSITLSSRTVVQYELDTQGLSLLPQVGAIGEQASKIAQTLQQRPSMLITETPLSTTDTGYDPVAQNVPGYAIMFMLFGVMMGAEAILMEKEEGTLRRLLTTPLPRWSFLAGKLMSNFIIGFSQLVIIFAVGHLIFGLDLGSSIPGLILISIATAFAANAAGMLLASFIKTRRQLGPVSTFFILFSSALGGSWWPLFITPQWMQNIAKVTITAWAMEGYSNLLMYGKGIVDILPQVGALLFYGAVLFAIGLKKFQFKES
ncbi:hypothetical protein AUK40_00205 [Candidatus Wirthbacteria bacterium CG2_30_54_11]|uniref:ABC transmembrane type-2 domain-containing protein n=1 Tax=Candidatus Wirthbacteria bacterium CG2_30_54_11 TaxID=1817892 RepID=A0A1J5J176_9BACT|nr:MAG: hypothetical protein AUK40_00205 [Candidatus Wirthbacteria bacterium CG2_30_54_11]